MDLFISKNITSPKHPVNEQYVFSQKTSCALAVISTLALGCLGIALVNAYSDPYSKLESCVKSRDLTCLSFVKKTYPLLLQEDSFRSIKLIEACSKEKNSLCDFIADHTISKLNEDEYPEKLKKSINATIEKNCILGKNNVCQNFIKNRYDFFSQKDLEKAKKFEKDCVRGHSLNKDPNLFNELIGTQYVLKKIISNSDKKIEECEHPCYGKADDFCQEIVSQTYEELRDPYIKAFKKFEEAHKAFKKLEEAKSKFSDRHNWSEQKIEEEYKKVDILRTECFKLRFYNFVYNCAEHNTPAHQTIVEKAYDTYKEINADIPLQLLTKSCKRQPNPFSGCQAILKKNT